MYLSFVVCGILVLNKFDQLINLRNTCTSDLMQNFGEPLEYAYYE